MRVLTQTFIKIDLHHRLSPITIRYRCLFLGEKFTIIFSNHFVSPVMGVMGVMGVMDGLKYRHC